MPSTTCPCPHLCPLLSAAYLEFTLELSKISLMLLRFAFTVVDKLGKHPLVVCASILPVSQFGDLCLHIISCMLHMCKPSICVLMGGSRNKVKENGTSIHDRCIGGIPESIRLSCRIHSSSLKSPFAPSTMVPKPAELLYVHTCVNVELLLTGDQVIHSFSQRDITDKVTHRGVFKPQDWRSLNTHYSNHKRYKWRKEQA